MQSSQFQYIIVNNAARLITLKLQINLTLYKNVIATRMLKELTCIAVEFKSPLISLLHT